MFSRTRRELEEVRVALAKAEAKLELLEPASDSMKRRIAELEGIRQKAEAALDEKMAVAAGALEREKQLEIKVAVLTERLDLLANYMPGAGEGSPRHMSEDEEDLQHMAAAGLIDKRQLEEALEAAGLTNNEISLDFQASDYPRLSG